MEVTLVLTERLLNWENFENFYNLKDKYDTINF